MSGNRLPGVENTTLRRRIMRAERAIIPKMLRVSEPRCPRRRGGAIHAADPAPQPPLHGARPASAAQTPIGALLVLPSDHPAAPWLSTSWTVPALACPLPDVPVPGQSAMPSSDAARWRGHGTHGANPAPQPPPLHAADHAAATTAATPRAGSKRTRSVASMDVRQPAAAEDPAVCAERGCPDLPAIPHPQVAERHAVYGTTLETLARTAPDSATLGPKNERRQTDADPDAVHTSVARAESPSTDFACFASAPLEDSVARAASISTDFTRVTSAENRAFARLLSSSAHGTRPGFLVQVGGAGATASDACDFSWAVQAGGEIEESMEAGHSCARAASICSDLARLTSEEDRSFARLLSDGVRFPRLGSESWHPLA